jgi:preprotein translocase SecE subunit
MKQLASYLKNVRAELGHVVWPSRKTAASHTILIVLLSAFTAVFIALLDYALTGVVGSFVTGF